MRTGKMIALLTSSPLLHRNLVTSTRINPGYLNNLRMQYSTVSHSDLSHINWTSASIHHFIIFLMFLPTAITSFSGKDSISKPLASAWSLKPCFVYPFPSAGSCSFFPFSFPIMQWRRVWLERRGTLRTSDYILFTHLSPNALIFCSLLPDYTS